MRRWFRRQKKNGVTSLEEREAPPGDETAAGPEAQGEASGGPTAGAAPPEPPSPEELPPEPAPEASEVSEAAAATAPEDDRKGLLRRFKERLSRTRDNLAGGLDRLFAGRQEVDAALLEELEELLITADLGVETTLSLIRALQEKWRRRELGEVARLKQVLKTEMVPLLQ